MGYAFRETILAGQLIFNKITTKGRTQKKGKRKEKKNPTLEQVQKMNQYYSEKELSIRLHHNFKPGDLHLTLTYSGEEPSKEKAKKEMKNFLERLKRLYKKHNQELKWILATEYENKRIHHHMVISYIDPKLLSKAWGNGIVRPSILDETGDWRKLAKYLIKETSKTFRKETAFSKRRWSCSRNVVTPNARVEEVSAEQLFNPKATKGYYVDQDSIWKGINPDTERPFMEYVQIAIDSPCKKYCRGKKRKFKKDKVKYTEKQISLAI
ncbi:rolling circle replication-associated protein [Anaerovoracaceae bacterium SGI.195]